MESWKRAASNASKISLKLLQGHSCQKTNAVLPKGQPTAALSSTLAGSAEPVAHRIVRVLGESQGTVWRRPTANRRASFQRGAGDLGTLDFPSQHPPVTEALLSVKVSSRVLTMHELPIWTGIGKVSFGENSSVFVLPASGGFGGIGEGRERHFPGNPVDFTETSCSAIVN